MPAAMKPKRPRARPPAVPEDLDAARCWYEGSREHKDRRSWLGLPRPRRTPRDVATICPMVTEQERDVATGWVRDAIRNGQFDRRDWRNGFPRYVWHRAADGSYWYAFLKNEGAGNVPHAQYKGWPISKDEWDEIFG
jgi:hypothetical protein